MKLWIAGGALVLLASCRSAATPTQPAATADVTGCYALRTGPWKGTAPDLPSRVELSPAASGRDPWLNLVPLEGRRYPFSFWNMQGESVRLQWSTGFSGVSAMLVRDGDRLKGTARTFWDSSAPEQLAPIVLERTKCDSRSNPRAPHS